MLLCFYFLKNDLKNKHHLKKQYQKLLQHMKPFQNSDIYLVLMVFSDYLKTTEKFGFIKKKTLP